MTSFLVSAGATLVLFLVAAVRSFFACRQADARLAAEVERRQAEERAKAEHDRAVAEADARAQQEHAAAEQVRKAGEERAAGEHAEAERIRGERPAEVFDEISRRRNAGNNGG